MALVKKSKIAAATSKPIAASAPPTREAAKPHVARAEAANGFRARRGRHRGARERLTEAAAATKQLGRSMEQIAAGAEEAAGASQEQSAAIKRIVASFSRSARRSREVRPPLRDFDRDAGGGYGADRRIRSLDRAQCRTPIGVRRRHHRARAAREGHRRDHANRQPHFGSDESACAERSDRGRASRRARPRLRRGRRRSARAGGNVRQERAGSAASSPTR